MPREDVGMATCRPFFLWLATAAVASALLRQMKEAVLPLNVVAYNPMSLDVDRLDEVADEIRPYRCRVPAGHAEEVCTTGV